MYPHCRTRTENPDTGFRHNALTKTKNLTYRARGIRRRKKIPFYFNTASLDLTTTHPMDFYHIIQPYLYPHTRV